MVGAEGADLTKPVPSQPTSSNRAEGAGNERQQTQRAQKMAQLKAQVGAGKYQIDTQALAARIQDSGVLDERS